MQTSPNNPPERAQIETQGIQGWRCRCGSRSIVTHPRYYESGTILRRRKCPNCGTVWKTAEILVRGD